MHSGMQTGIVHNKMNIAADTIKVRVRNFISISSIKT